VELGQKITIDIVSKDSPSAAGLQGYPLLPSRINYPLQFGSNFLQRLIAIN